MIISASASIYIARGLWGVSQAAAPYRNMKVGEVFINVIHVTPRMGKFSECNKKSHDLCPY